MYQYQAVQLSPFTTAAYNPHICFIPDFHIHNFVALDIFTIGVPGEIRTLDPMIKMVRNTRFELILLNSVLLNTNRASCALPSELREHISYFLLCIYYTILF